MPCVASSLTPPRLIGVADKMAKNGAFGGHLAYVVASSSASVSSASSSTIASGSASGSLIVPTEEQQLLPDEIKARETFKYVYYILLTATIISLILVVWLRKRITLMIAVLKVRDEMGWRWCLYE